jgi:uracil-DNA glycosylase family 4
MADLLTSLQRVLQDEREVFGDFLVLEQRPPADEPPSILFQSEEASTLPRKRTPSTEPVNEAWGSAASLPDLDTQINICMKCPLGKTRTKFVFGVGNPHARLMFIGEAPGADEDAQGEPFVGRAGQLLNKILVAIQMKREEVYIANILKCRPPNNRTPIPEEVEACMPYLKKQIALIKPQIIVCLGLTAAQNLLGINDSLGKLRGRLLSFENTPLMVTYHPAALLRNPNWKPAAWEDFQAVQKYLADHAGDVKEGTTIG